MKMNSLTEVINQYVRESAVSPDKESRIINIGEISNIFSIGTDKALYLTKENEIGEKSRFSRYKLIETVVSFAAEKINNSTIAVAAVVNDDVYISYTQAPETLTLNDFYKLDFRGVLGGIKLAPYRVLLTAFGKTVSLFVEFHDVSGFTQQFMVSLDENAPVNAAYYRLASEFTEVICNAAGRSAQQYVDGVYTYGIFYAGNDSPYAEYVSNAPQLLYTPCRNVFGNTPPSPIRLKTEVNLEAICSLEAPKADHNGTHLFAVGEGRLFVYPFHHQMDYLQEPGMGIPLLIEQNDKLLNAKQIAAYFLADRLYIFIRTAGGELHYTVADHYDDRTTADDFLEPVNLMSDVVSFDLHNGKISIFTKKEFIECTQNPETGAFAMDEVRVGTELDTHSEFSAFSTRIYIGKADAAVTVNSKSGEKIGFYSGDYYYKTSKIVLKADNLGYVTILQRADGISPDCYTITYDGETLDINPAHSIQTKLLSMTGENDFKDAVITDMFGNTTPLAANPKKSSLAAAAAGMSSLHNTSIGMIPGVSNPITKFANGVAMTITDKIISFLPTEITDNPFTKFVAHVVSDLTAAFKWITGKIKALYDKTVGKAINFIIQKTKKCWQFLAEIGGKVISVVIDSVAKIVETIKNVLELVGIPVDKIIDFAKKALGLDRTDCINAAIKNLAKISIDMLIEKASEMKKTSIDFLSEAIDVIQAWAGIDQARIDSSISAGSLVENPIDKLSSMGISLDSNGMYFFDLVKGSITPEISMPEVTFSDALKSATEKLLHDITEIGEKIGKIPEYFAYIADEIETLISDFSFENLLSVLKKILGVVAVEFLNISRAIIQTIFDIVIEGIRAVWMAISSPIQIPFLSGVLKIFGINEFSLLDILTYPTAFLASAVSTATKLLTGDELFDIDSIDKFSKVKSLKEIRQTGGAVYG